MLPATSVQPAFRLAPFHSLAMVAVLASTLPSGVRAQSPLVHFDMNPAVACRDVTPPEFAAANPDERLVEARFEISALIRQGNEDNLLQFFYRLETQEHSVSVADYSPKTTLASDQAGNVTMERKSEKSNHAGVTLSSPVDWPGKVTASSDLGQKAADSTRYELVPQMIAVTASGTIQQGRGVYFKLKPSRSHTLEGARQFTVVLRVPRTWRGGYAYLACNAAGIDRGFVRPLDEQILSGARRFVVALYLEGDGEAKAAAQRLVRAETDLYRAVSSRRAELERLNRPTLRQRFDSLFGSTRPPIPANWTQQLVFAQQPQQIDRIADRLPPEVQEAIAEYNTARSQLRFLADGAEEVH